MPLHGLVRFFPAEWLPQLPRRSGWELFFLGAQTPQSNPGASLLTQSKRLPLLWDRMKTDMSTWRALLPETRHPRGRDYRNNPRWVLKPALGRVGCDVGIHGSTPPKEMRSIRRAAFWRPRHWIAQTRFDAVPLPSPDGTPLYPSIGVFVIEGKAAGAYGRAVTTPPVNHRAFEMAVLVEDEVNAEATMEYQGGELHVART